ncbi:MAG TPA: alpha/beta hydrolase [Chloroflexota bacterium]|nr:alpha/beta hydrolase [Chloroflexota bacterium]
MAILEPTTGFNIAQHAGNEGLVPKFVDADGIPTRYYDVGDPSAEPLVLCHGAGWSGTSSANTFARNLRGLGERFHVFAADKLGSGLTGNPPTEDGYSIQGQVAHMWAFMRAVGLGDTPFHILGQSRGGYLAARTALEHADQVSSLVVVDSATLAPEDGQGAERRRRLLGNEDSDLGPDPRTRMREHWSRMSFTTEHVTDEFVEAAAYMESTLKAQETKRVWKSGGEQRFGSTLKEQKEETLRWFGEGKLQKPILLYWGRNDPTAILPLGLALYDLIAEADDRTRMFIVNRAGHFHYREYPDEFNLNVTTFIRYWAES